LLLVRIEKGEVQNLGTSMVANHEKIFALSPDIIFKSGFNGIRSKDKVLLQSEIPVVYDIEWQETSPLARAEWIKFIGAFLGKDSLANALFENIETRYLAIKEKAQHLQERPKVLGGSNYKGTWYIPGGQSYIADLFRDAGAEYLWEKDTTTGSIPVSFEVVLERAANADYWIGVEADTRDQLLGEDSRYDHFAFYKSGNIYNNNKKVNAQGGNDYWETGIHRPDILLADLITIFHPELFPDRELEYYKRLE